MATFKLKLTNMKLYSILIFMTLLIACNSADKKEEKPISEADTQPVEAVKESNVQLVDINTDEALVATALMAAPKESREGCTVIGFNMEGEFVTFKEGTNEFICITDDPKRDGFNAACYHKSLDEFMARGRELRKQGLTGGEIFDIREEEAKAGKLSMGDPGATLHIYYGEKTQYDPETNKVDGAVYRYVVYLPFATSESTGLPEFPIAPNHPWIMNPGTHRAHIMITPINEEK